MDPNEFSSPYLLSLPEGSWNINGEKDGELYLYVSGPIEREFSEPGTYTFTSESTGVTETFHVYPGSKYVVISKGQQPTTKDVGLHLTDVDA